MKTLNKEAAIVVAAVTVLVTLALGFLSAGWDSVMFDVAGVMVHRTTQQEVLFLLSHVVKQVPAGVLTGVITALAMW